MKVYTKSGDKGTTALFGGSRVGKDDLRIEAYGTVDELNSFTGVLNDHLKDKKLKQQMVIIQSTLFNVGSNLATNPTKRDKVQLPAIGEQDVAQLEQWIDKMEDTLPRIKNFILPGGHPAGSAAHVCRSVCRRAERAAIRLRHADEPVDDFVIKYLNRLSDFFFVFARYIVFKNGGEEVIWQAGKN